MVITGLEIIVRDPHMLDDAGRLGLLYNQASVDSRLQSAPDLIHRAFPGRLRALLGPQHGVWCTEQDNMIETDHAEHPRLGLPIFSLYAATREPTPDMLNGVDTILVDIQDVGTRVYTFATTVLYLMRACARWDISVIVLDRPNPIDGVTVEGNLLVPEYASFVGPYPLPMRHAMTLGELMWLYNEVHEVGCRLRIVRTMGWNRNRYFEETGLPWVMPSPNMPSVQTAEVYPGQVVLEGTNLSEGRGTTLPFQIFGAPYLEPDLVLERLESRALEGAILREVQFRPTFNKWVGTTGKGFQLHVMDRVRFRPYRASLAILAAILKAHPGEFRWSEPPYEYVYDRMPIDVIAGDSRVRHGLEEGASVFELESEWQADMEEFSRVRSHFLLYGAA